jgi:hypothetical protein
VTSKTNEPVNASLNAVSDPSKRRAGPRLVEGAVTTNWKRALEQLVLAYPDRVAPHLH